MSASARVRSRQSSPVRASNRNGPNVNCLSSAIRGLLSQAFPEFSRNSPSTFRALAAKVVAYSQSDRNHGGTCSADRPATGNVSWWLKRQSPKRAWPMIGRLKSTWVRCQRRGMPRASLLIAALTLTAGGICNVGAEAPTLAGKTVTMIIAAGAGDGGLNVWGRVVARHIGRCAGRPDRRGAEHAGCRRVRRRQPHLQCRGQGRHCDGDYGFTDAARDQSWGLPARGSMRPG